MPSRTGNDGLGELEREQMIFAEGASDARPSGQASGLAELDEAFREFTDIFAEGEPGQVERARALEELTRALLTSRQLVANLSAGSTGDEQRERQMLEKHIQRLEQLRERSRRLLTRVDERLESLRRRLEAL